MNLLHEDDYTEEDPEYFEQSMSGSTGWIVVSYGQCGDGVVLAHDDRLGAFDYILEAVGGNNLEDFGIDYAGESETVKLWVVARACGGDVDGDLEFSVVKAEVLWAPEHEVEGLTRRRCTHRVLRPTRAPDRGFRLMPDLTPPGLACELCGWRKSGKALGHLRELILQRDANTCRGCGVRYPEGGIHGERKIRGKPKPVCYPCAQQRDHGVQRPEILEGEPFEWEEGARASENVINEEGEVDWKAAHHADPGIVSCPACHVHHWREGDLVACAICHHEWRLNESKNGDRQCQKQPTPR